MWLSLWPTADAGHGWLTDAGCVGLNRSCERGGKGPDWGPEIDNKDLMKHWNLFRGFYIFLKGWGERMAKLYLIFCSFGVGMGLMLSLSWSDLSNSGTGGSGTRP